MVALAIFQDFRDQSLTIVYYHRTALGGRCAPGRKQRWRMNTMGLQDSDRGLGTTFERFAVYKWLEETAARHSFHTVFEGPGDGVAGIPGIHSLSLARTGHPVTVALDSPAEIALARKAWACQAESAMADFVCVQGLALPLPSRRFELVWNFNRLPYLNPRALVAEMARVSNQYVALVVPNRRNYGFPARRLYHRRTRIPWPYGNTEVMDPGTVRRLLEDVGLRILEVRWLDVPWWPDVLDPGAWLAAMVPGTERLLANSKRDGYCWTPDSLPYFDPDTYSELHLRMRRLGWLERMRPTLFRIPFAHHFAVLAARQDAPH